MQRAGEAGQVVAGRGARLYRGSGAEFGRLVRLRAGLVGRPGQSPPEPSVPEGPAGGHPELGVPLQAPLYEVEEQGVLAALEGLLQVLGARGAPELAPARQAARELYAAVGVEAHRAVPGVALGAYELPGPLRPVQESLWRHPQELDYARQLVRLVFPREQGKTREELRQDAAQGPHVYRHAVGRAQDHLRGSVEPRLDVRVHPLVLVTARAKVYHLENFY